MQILRRPDTEETPTQLPAVERVSTAAATRGRQIQRSSSEQGAACVGSKSSGSDEEGDPAWLINLRLQMNQGECAYPAESALATASASCNRKEGPDRKFDSRSKEGNVENKKKKTEKQTEKWKKQQQAGLQEAREYCEGEGEVPARKKRRWQKWRRRERQRKEMQR